MRLSQLAPLPLRRAVWRVIETSVVPAASNSRRPANGPLVIAGMFTTASGIGESARLAFAALQACGLDPLAFDTSPILGQGDMTWDGPLIDTLPDTREGLLAVYNNAPELGRILLYAGRRQRRDWCVASLWAWETSSRPAGWIERAALADELWFPSRFVRDAISPKPPTRSLVAFHPVPPPQEPPSTSGEDLIPPGPTVFTCYADALSSLTRKNPMGAIEAFRTAFGENPNVRLVVKSRNARDTSAGRALATAIADAPNILHIDRALSPTEMQGLRARTDVLVSLHRSEGFGLTLAEAMRSSTPVIATDWSAPTEFLSDECAYLVPAREIPADDEFGVYRETGHKWADPDLTTAARLMQQVADDPDDAGRRAERARAQAETLFSAEAYRRALDL